MSRPGAPATARGELTIGKGVRRLLPGILSDAGAARVLLVASPRAAQSSGVSAMLRRFDTCLFSGFSPNPVLEQALAGSALRERCRPDLIVAVGGGSAIDTAKLLRSLPADRAAALRVLARDEEPQPDRHRPLVAVPTTAGTGSEVTRFATVYVGGVKVSLDYPTVLPEHALVDPELLGTCPGWLLHSCAFDALCHAVESYWSARSTPVSRRFALQALRGIVTVLAGDLRALGDDERCALAAAATTAGRAIDITRTTAAHAFSYRLTSRFGVPHGVACLLNLLWLFDYNAERAQAAAGGPGAASGSARSARDRMATLSAALRPLQSATTAGALRSLLGRGGFPDRLRGYGVRRADIADLVDAGLASDRSGNNPAAVDRKAATERLSALV